MEGNWRPTALGIAATSGALLMTELALTRIFSVTMFYHFAFFAISIALFGLSASGVLVYVMRRRLAPYDTGALLCVAALAHMTATVVALACLVRIPVSLTYSLDNLTRMLAIYLLAAAPFFTGGAVLSIAFSRLTARINTLYACDLLGAALGCLALVPLMNLLGAPGVVLTAAALAAIAAVLFAPAAWRRRARRTAFVVIGVPLALQLGGLQPFEISAIKGALQGDLLFSKWNSFSRVGVYDRTHHEWSLSPKYAGKPGPSLYMDIDASASTPILKIGDLDEAAYLRHELTAIGYHLVERPGGFEALVIGPGGGRDVLSALVFGARRVEGVEINPIIVRDVMLERFRDYSGGLYARPEVSIHVEDGRSYVRRSPRRYDVIQASLVDTWAATAAGAYTLTENSLYTVEAFEEYLEHLTPEGLLSFTRWVHDGLRLVSLAQEACARLGLDAAQHVAIVQHQMVMTFILKRSRFTPAEVRQLARVSSELGFTLLYAPGVPAPAARTPIDMARTGASLADYRGLLLAPERKRFLEQYRQDISATTDDRPFYFLTARLRDQLSDTGLSALFSLFVISGGLVLAFIVAPLALGAERPRRGWSAWLAYFAALGAAFMLLEVALLQRFVLLLGHPVYSLTVTLFALLLGTGLGSLLSRRVPSEAVRRVALRALAAAAGIGVLAAFGLAPLVDLAIAWPLWLRIAAATLLLVPVGALLGIGLPAGMRLLDQLHPELVAWGWGMNGAFSVIGATTAIFIAMNWGFSITLLAAALTYLLAAGLLRNAR